MQLPPFCSLRKRVAGFRSRGGTWPPCSVQSYVRRDSVGARFWPGPRAGPARAGVLARNAQTLCINHCGCRSRLMHLRYYAVVAFEVTMLPIKNRPASIVGPVLALLTASLSIGAQGFNSEPLQQLDTKTIAVQKGSAPDTPAFSRKDPAVVDEEDGRLEDVDCRTAGSISPHGGDFRSAIAALSSGAPRRDAAQDEKQRSRGLVSVSGSTIGAPIPQGNPILHCFFIDCITGCPSRYYRLIGTGRNVTATTCGTTSFRQRTYVWKGSSCGSLVCVCT